MTRGIVYGSVSVGLKQNMNELPLSLRNLCEVFVRIVVVIWLYTSSFTVCPVKAVWTRTCISETILKLGTNSAIKARCGRTGKH